MQILGELDEPGQEGPALHSLGYIYHQMGDYERAVVCYEHALRLANHSNDRYGEATVLDHLGDSRHALGHPGTARRDWAKALQILTDLSHPHAQRIQDKLHGVRGLPPHLVASTVPSGS